MTKANKQYADNTEQVTSYAIRKSVNPTKLKIRIKVKMKMQYSPEPCLNLNVNAIRTDPVIIIRSIKIKIRLIRES